MANKGGIYLSGEEVSKRSLKNPFSKIMPHVFFILILFLLCFAIFFPFLHTGQFYADADWSFHANRVEEIFDNLKEGHFFTFIATHVFNHTGVGNFLFYPTLFLYPWAFLRFIFGPVTAFLVWLFLIFILTVLISYFSMYSFSKNRLQSFIFSILYLAIPYNFVIALSAFDLGQTIETTFLPLIFLGIYNILWGNYKKFYPLVFGITFIAYSHVLGVLLSLEILLGIFLGKIINNKGIDRIRFWFLVKSALSTIVLSLPVIIPYLTNYIGQNVILTGENLSGYLVGVYSLGKTFTDALSNNGSVGLILLIIAIFGFFYIRKNKQYRSFYLIGITLILFSTTIFPWFLFKKEFISIIQFPYRYTSYCAVFLAAVASKIFSHFLETKNITNAKKVTFSLVFPLVSLFLIYGSTNQINNITKPYPKNVHSLEVKKNKAAYMVQPGALLNNQNYKYQFDYLVKFGLTDYFPHKSHKKKNAGSIISQNVKKASSTKIQNTQFSANKIIYKLNVTKTNKVDFPFLKYKNTYAKINGKKTKILKSFRNTTKINLTPGNKRVEIYYKAPLIYWIGWIVSVIYLAFLIILFFKRKKISK